MIFISGYVEFLPVAHENAALRFIIKPVTYAKVQEAIACWLKIIRQRYFTFEFISEGKQCVLYDSEILYIESKDKILSLITRKGAQYRFKGQLKTIEQQLASVNYSFVINLQHIVDLIFKARCGEAILSLEDSGVVSVPISVRKRAEVMVAYDRYLKVGSMTNQGIR